MNNSVVSNNNKNILLRRPSLVVLGLLLGTVLVPALAATTASDNLSWGKMAIQLMGGLALFLFGMEQMADALKAVAGERMKVVLARLTTNRFMGAVTGAFVTAVIQSSSVTTVLVVGFISAGLMSMAQSIGVIMGANVGTTITAQIVAFQVTQYALLMIAAGFGMLFFFQREKVKQYGAMLMGLGLVFFGMGVMSDAMKPLRDYQPFLDLMISMETPLVGILVAAAFTGLVQSSSATTGIVIVMASQGFITLPAGIALAFGANIGTCVTAMLASIGKPREALRAALVHVFFNVFGVLVWLAFINHLAEFVTWISPASADLSGVDKLAAETPRQIANAHTLFNIANTLIFIGFTTQFARLVNWMVPDAPVEEKKITQPKFLDEELLETPSLALDRVRLEIANMGQLVMDMLQRIMPALLEGDRNSLRKIARVDDDVDVLHRHIITYLGQLSRKSMTDLQSSGFVDLMASANDLENIGDIIETDLVDLGDTRIQNRVTISPTTKEMLTQLHKEVALSLSIALNAVMENDQRAAQTVIGMKSEISRLAKSAEVHQAERLLANEPNRLNAYTLEVEAIEKLKRIYYFAKRIAKTVMPPELAGKTAEA